MIVTCESYEDKDDNLSEGGIVMAFDLMRINTSGQFVKFRRCI